MDSCKRITAAYWKLALLIYLLLPIIAGSLRIGNKRGPLIYPEFIHIELFSIAYRLVHHTKPRVPAKEWGGNRPFFYPVFTFPTE
jgi:hypothetical protein